MGRSRCYFFSGEVVAKRLSVLHELVPKAVRVAVLVNIPESSPASIIDNAPASQRLSTS
jgi:hypothetical protein